MNPDSIDIVYFVPELPAGSSGVLHAQVLTPAGVLSRNGYKVLFLGADHADNAAAAARDIQAQYGIPAEVIGSYSSRLGFLSVWSTTRKAGRFAESVLGTRSIGSIYVRSFIGAAAGRVLAGSRGARLVYDVRASRSEEVAMARGRGIRYRISRRAEVPEIRRADRVACVSTRLAQWVHTNSGRDDAVIIPCCIDRRTFSFDGAGRERIRVEFGFQKDQTVLCYCGGLSVWQRIDDVIRLLKAVGVRDPQCRFLFLTPGTELLRRKLEVAGPPMDRCVITNCAHNEVASYLSAADVGVIMRDDVVVNNVASPVKIAEYLACKLPVILTEGIGDLTDLVRREGVGVVLDESSDPAGQVTAFLARPDMQALREKAERVCHQYLSFDCFLDHYRALFGEASA